MDSSDILPSDGRQAQAAIETISADLTARGYAILSAALPGTLLDALHGHVNALPTDAFTPAGIGRGEHQQHNASIRSDVIHWLDTGNYAVQGCFAWMERLRLELNRRLFLGLFDYECLVAHYPPGAFYRRHVDAFKGETNRVVTTLLYLNRNWSSQDGGELLLYAPDGDAILERVAPVYGTLVVFLSAEFPHEVLPARRTRHSIAGWFRVNRTSGHVVDPSR